MLKAVLFKFNQTSSIHQKILMEEAQIDIVDVQASPLSESMQLEASPLSESSLSELMKRKIDRGKTNEAKNFTIFRTPHNISQSKKNLFEPSVVSIGPFHRGKKSLKAMEEHKWRLLDAFLSRRDSSLDRRDATLDLFISEMKFLEETTRRCYSETFDDLDCHAFVEMMLLDGCFLLEYLKLFEGNWNSILEVGWNFEFIKRDLLLQENQIPFFIVDKLQELIGINQERRMFFVKYLALFLLPKDYILPAPPAETPETIVSIIADPPSEIPNPPDEIPEPPSEIPNLPAEFPDHVPAAMPDNLAQIPEIQESSAEIRDPLAEIPDPPAEIHHLIHLCYHYLVPDLGTTPLSSSTRNISSAVIPSATELKQKGVKFTPKSNPKHMLDISFKNGVLKIPRLKITDDTKPLFTNLLAFEQSKFGRMGGPFTSFLVFLDNLVNTENDVTILQECKIIENWLGSEEALTHFFNHVTEGGGLDEEDHYLADLNREVNRYIESSWNKHRAKLIRDYFSSPWAAISLFAAFILLGLTFMQTFYAVYAYKFPPRS